MIALAQLTSALGSATLLGGVPQLAEAAAPASAPASAVAAAPRRSAVNSPTVTPISGLVFGDNNSDGQLTANGTLTETGVGGVTVTVYDKTGSAVGSATTASNGTYAITPLTDLPYRVEFSNLPNGFLPSRVAGSTQNGTTVQFISAVAQASNVNLAIIDPCDYCQSNPLLAGSRNIYSDTAIYLSVVSILAYPYNTTQADDTKRPTEFSSVTYGQLGNTWGRTWKRDTQELFTSAYSARGLALGTGGAGGIYKVTGMNSGGARTAAVFATIPNAGTVASNATRLLQNMPKVLDTAMYTNTGKVGLGALTISSDMSTIYAMNLNDRSIYPSGRAARGITIGLQVCFWKVRQHAAALLRSNIHRTNA